MSDTKVIIPGFMCVHDPFTGKNMEKETLDHEMFELGYDIVSSSLRAGIYRAKLALNDDTKACKVIAAIADGDTYGRYTDMVVEFKDDTMPARWNC